MNELCQLYKKIFSLVILILVVFFVFPLIFGYNAYAIETGSMEPTIPAGSIIYIKEINRDEYKLNDVITFEKSNEVVTHRIVGIDQVNNQFTTKGDGVIYNDEDKLSFTMVKGKVEYSMPFLGYILIFLKSIEGIIIGFILVSFYIFSLFISDHEKGNKSNEKSENTK